MEITSFYLEFLKSYYLNNSTIVHISNSEQYDDLMAMKYGCSNAFQTGLIELNNEGYEIVSNVYPLQIPLRIKFLQFNKLSAVVVHK